MTSDELRDVFAAFALMGLLSAHGKQPGIGGFNLAKDAFDLADQMIKENPKDFRPYVGKAQLKQVQGKDDEAKKLFDKGLELAPADFKDEVKRLAALSPQKQPNSNSTQSPSSTSDTPTKKP